MSKQANTITILKDERNIEYYTNYPVTNLLAMVHNDIFALTINVANCMSLDATRVSKLNRLLSSHYSNAFFVLVKYRASLFLSLRQHHEIIDLDTYMPSITVQGRSWDDYCLRIINLEQNYRWETTHHYNSTAS